MGFSRQESFAIGAGMSGRGAVELIIANIALQANLFSVPEPPPPIVANLFSTIVIMAIVRPSRRPFSFAGSFRGMENRAVPDY
jgi:Kef-type K+ transport system membrane component KefB